MNKQMSRKIAKIIKKYYRPSLDCDGQSRMFSWLLEQEGIEHQVRVGAVAWQGNLFPIHYWIAFPGSDYVLDCKLRKWFGESQDIPAGLFEWDGSIESPLQYVWLGDYDSMVMTYTLFDALDKISKER